MIMSEMILNYAVNNFNCSTLTLTNIGVRRGLLNKKEIRENILHINNIIEGVKF